jgi:hypothetical protein
MRHRVRRVPGGGANRSRPTRCVSLRARKPRQRGGLHLLLWLAPRTNARPLQRDRRRAFFAQAAPITLGPLPADQLAKYLVDRFGQAKRDPGEALGPLLDAAEGHPQRAMLLSHHLYERLDPGGRADIEVWVDALHAARVEAQGEIAVLWESCTSLERKALKVIVQRTIALGSRNADLRYGLAKGGSAQAAVERLFADGHLIEDESSRTGWRIVDPFLASFLWVAVERGSADHPPPARRPRRRATRTACANGS